LVWGSTHAPPQTSWPDVGHAQVPPWQVCPEAQVAPAWAPEQVPLAPQWVVLVWGSTHAPSHATRPDGQGTVQAPLEQTVPTAQMLPQTPQLRLSAWVCTQTPPQDTVPLAQVEATLQPIRVASANNETSQIVRVCTRPPGGLDSPKGSIYLVRVSNKVASRTEPEPRT
jgi:hypothetical protein